MSSRGFLAGGCLFVLGAVAGCSDSTRAPHDSSGAGEGGAGEGLAGTPNGSVGGTSPGGEGGADAGASGRAEGPGGAGGMGGLGGEGPGGQGPGGEAPGGQPGCAPFEQARCDDGNECTADSCAPSGCQHEVRVDGAPCDDQNACTSDDRCEAGRCKGEALATAAQTGGVLRTFASDPLQVWNDVNRGLALSLSDELLVFTERGERRGYGVGLELVLVRSVAGKLEPLARVPTSFSNIENLASGVFPSHYGLHLVRMNEHRFALVGRDRGSASGAELEIFDADASGLSLVGERQLFGDGITTVWDAEGHGDRLWLLSPTGPMSAYEIAADGAVTRLAGFPTFASASAFAASEDHRLLYVGTQGGTFRVDVSDLAHPVADPSPVIPEDSESQPYQMTLQGDVLFIQSEGLWATIRDARLYGGPNLALMRRFPSTPAVDSPLGAAFTQDGLLLQRMLYQDNKPSELRAELYSLAGGAVTLSDSLTYADLGALEFEATEDADLVPYFPTANGSRAVLGPSRRVVSTDAGHLTELNGPLQGGFDSVRPAGPSSVIALGRESAHRVSLGLNGPVLERGGLLAPATSAPQRLVLLEPEASRFPLFASPPVVGKSNGRLAWLEAATGEAPSSRGFVDLRHAAAASSALWGATTRLLFRLEPSLKDSSGTLRVYPLAARGMKTVDEAIPPLELPAEGDAYLALLAVEPNGDVFIVARAKADGTQIRLARYERAANGYELTSTFVLPCQEGLDGALMRGDMLTLLYDNKQRLALLRHDEFAFNQVATRHLETKGGGSIASRLLLGIEGNRLYLSNGYDDDVQPGILAGIDAFHLPDLATVAHYLTPQEMTSFTANGETLVFGGPSALMTATAECSP